MAFDKKRKLPEKDAENLARHIIDHGQIIFTQHAENERMPERGFEKSDVYRILQKGKVVKTEPGVNDTWKYSFLGDDCDGDEGTVVIAFVSSSDGLIITVF